MTSERAAEHNFIIYFKPYPVEAGDHGGHAVIHLVRAENAIQALVRYLQTQLGDLNLGQDGSLTAHGIRYPHPLAYIEAYDKRYGEWQMRQLPTLPVRATVLEVMCGDDNDWPAYIVTRCQKEYRKEFPRSRAKAFVWYLKSGALVTFYRKNRRYGIDIIRRYLYRGNGQEDYIAKWEGDHKQIMRELVIDNVYEVAPANE